jgi:outer membrane protein OmpA-like peptidoglycan-associated protein
MRLLLALGGALALAGCATSKERVTLLSPVQDGKDVGAVVVEDDEGNTLAVLDAANEQAALRGARPPKLEVLEQDNALYRELMADLPPLAARELFYFAFESDQLSASELDRLQAWLERNIQGRPGLQIDIAAHTDAMGTEDFNNRLSERRAKAVLAQVMQRIADARINIDSEDIQVVASGLYWARSSLAPGEEPKDDPRYRVVVVTVR